MKKDNIVSGKNCSATDNLEHPLLQVAKTASTWYGKFITNGSSPYNWNPYHDTPNSADGLWQSGRNTRNDPCSHYKVDSTYVEFWHEGNAGEDPGNGVCQDAGTAWKIPTSEEWGSIYKGGILTGSPVAATANTWVWDDGGITTSGANYTYTRPAGYQIRPDNVTTTLFLPANGNRSGSNGSLYRQGTDGYYWRSSVTGTNAYSLHFHGTGLNPAYSGHRVEGFAVRCVKHI
jgi:hypothetical protein